MDLPNKVKNADDEGTSGSVHDFLQNTALQNTTDFYDCTLKIPLVKMNDTVEPMNRVNKSEEERRLQVKKGKSKKDLEEEEREKMLVLVSNFTEEQLDRYEMYRRAAFPKASIKRMMQMITGNPVSQNVVIAMAGITKVFIGEIVEDALDDMERLGERGPLQPKHLRAAVRHLRARDKIPNLRDRKRNYILYS